jgi:hypothetical protein
VREPTPLSIAGNPGAWISENSPEPDEWNSGNADVLLKHFHFNPDSATEAEIEICVQGHDGVMTSTSAELTFDDVVRLAKALNKIAEYVVAEGRDAPIPEA